MLENIAKKYYSDQWDLNCAEAILYAANEAYQLNLSKDTLRAMAGFGGGMGIEGVCGAISGAIAALGILFVKDKAKESDLIKELSEQFMNEFRKQMGTDNCRELKEKYRTEQTKCSLIVEKAAQVLNDVMNTQ